MRFASSRTFFLHDGVLFHSIVAWAIPPSFVRVPDHTPQSPAQVLNVARGTHIQWDHAYRDGPVSKCEDLAPKARTGVLRGLGVAGAADARWDRPERRVGGCEAERAGEDGAGERGRAGDSAGGCGKHTYASQFVAVNTAGGTVVLASDNM